MLDSRGGEMFSLLLNKSLDVRVSKHLGIIPSSQFYLSSKGVASKGRTCLAWHTDEASVMTGVYNGVNSSPREDSDSKHLVLIQYVRHSLQLSSSKIPLQPHTKAMLHGRCSKLHVQRLT